MTLMKKKQYRWQRKELHIEGSPSEICYSKGDEFFLQNMCIQICYVHMRMKRQWIKDLLEKFHQGFLLILFDTGKLHISAIVKMRKQRKSILQSSLFRKFNFSFYYFILISKSDKNLEALGIFCYLELIRASITSANFKFTICAKSRCTSKAPYATHTLFHK